MSERRKDAEAPDEARLSTWLPEPGTVVSIGSHDGEHSWTSRVEHLDGTAVVVVAPTAGGRPVPLPPGSPIVIGWATELGYLEAEGVLTDTAVDVVLTWEVDANRVLRKQRRAAFRLPVALPIAMLERSREAPVDGVSPVEGRTRDVSEVGVRCVLPMPDAPETDDEVLVTVAIPDEEAISSRARVVWSRPSNSSHVEVALAFSEDDHQRAERLRRFVFAEQLDRRAGRIRPASRRHH